MIQEHIDRYLKISSGELEPKKSSRVYRSLIDDYKSIIIEKVDTYGATAMAIYKFIEKKGYKGKYSTVAAFRYFAEIPQEILFNNMKTVVDRTKSTLSNIKFNKTFRYFADDSGFKPIDCRIGIKQKEK